MAASRCAGCASVAPRSAVRVTYIAGSRASVAGLVPRFSSRGRLGVPRAADDAKGAARDNRAERMAEMFNGGTEPEGLTLSTVLGSYGIMALFTGVLIYSGVKGYYAVMEDPQSAGMLLAPPSAAALLIVSFLVYRLVIKPPKKSRRA